MHPCVRPSAVGCHLITKTGTSKLQMNLVFWWKSFILVFCTQKKKQSFFWNLIKFKPLVLNFSLPHFHQVIVLCFKSSITLKK